MKNKYFSNSLEVVTKAVKAKRLCKAYDIFSFVAIVQINQSSNF